eukprot:Blabericola_migrator_1__727@NODE_1181_length_5200_cov_79_295928_g803_i0_p4_GENE_NODE_1181_length_5200_cov_79_295928_g803_i0NODE_1181_length_5200_cov_79_295928_g803_i0_p4_ORF_typecomplete_len116_score19_27_NODE_1181_length_5200_cov_79_295928_g803_i045654912
MRRLPLLIFALGTKLHQVNGRNMRGDFSSVSRVVGTDVLFLEMSQFTEADGNTVRMAALQQDGDDDVREPTDMVYIDSRLQSPPPEFAGVDEQTTTALAGPIDVTSTTTIRTTQR